MIFWKVVNNGGGVQPDSYDAMEINKMNEEQILNELENFIGTEAYHKFSICSNIVLTDGMKFLCDTCQSYWLLDIVASVQQESKIMENRNFIVWRIKLNEYNKSFIVSAYKDSPFNKENLLYEQVGGYTDFPLKSCDNVLLLTREY